MKIEIDGDVVTVDGREYVPKDVPEPPLFDQIEPGAVIRWTHADDGDGDFKIAAKRDDEVAVYNAADGMTVLVREQVNKYCTLVTPAPPVPIQRRVHYGSKFRREDDEIRAVTGISVDGVRSDGTCWTWDEFEARCTLLPEED